MYTLIDYGRTRPTLTSWNSMFYHTLPDARLSKREKRSYLVLSSFTKPMGTPQLTYGRWEVQHSAGTSSEDIAGLETVTGIGILSKTVPSAFWTPFGSYSRSKLLAQLREEIVTSALQVDASINSGANPTHVIDLAAIKDQCPLLLLAFQEFLSLRSNGTATRLCTRTLC